MKKNSVRGQDARAHPELVARRGRQRVQVGVRDHRAGVVAVEAGAEVAEELGLGPRAQDQVGLHVRTGLDLVAVEVAAGGVDVLLDVEAEDVAPGAGDQADLVERGEVELHERRDRLLDDVDVLGPAPADGAARRWPAPRAGVSIRYCRPTVDVTGTSNGRESISYWLLKPGQEPRVALVDHVAGDGIVEEEREVVEQAQRVVGHVGLGHETLVSRPSSSGTRGSGCVRWVMPPSLGSMAPKRSMRPERTARVGISPEPCHSA